MHSETQHFETCVQHAFFHPDSSIRIQNESILTQTLKNDPDHFVSLCASILAKPSPSQTKQTVAALLKIALEKTQTQGQLWQLISSSSQDTLKTVSLEMLVNNDPSLRVAAANLTGIIFVMDCQHEQTWGSLLDTLAECQKHREATVRTTAVKTTGIICELLCKYNVECLSRSQKDALLTGVCQGLQEFSDDTLECLKALENSCDFFVCFLESEDIRDFLMNLLLSNLLESVNQLMLGVVCQVLICLRKLIALMEKYFAKYCDVICGKVLQIYPKADETTFIAVNDFFQSMLDSRNQQSTEFSTCNLETITKNALEHGVRLLQNIHDFTSQDRLLESILDLVTSINSRSHSKLKDTQLQFILANIDQRSLSKKCLALLVLESWIELPKTEEVYNWVFRSFLGVISEFKSSKHTIVKHRALQVLLKISDFYPNIILGGDYFQVFYEAMRDPFIYLEDFCLFETILKLWENVSRNFNYQHIPSLLIEKHEEVIQNLLRQLDHPSSTLFVKDVIYRTSLSMIRYLTLKEELPKWLIWFWQRQEQVRKTNTHQLLEIEHVFGGVNIILQTIAEKKLQSFTISDTQLLEMARSIESLFSSYNEVLPEALSVYGSIINLRPCLFKQSIERILNTYLLPCLNQRDRFDLFTVSICMMTSLTTHFRQETRNEVQSLFPRILEILQNPEVSKDINLKVLSSLADLVAASPELAKANLAQVLELLEFGFEALVSMNRDLYCKKTFDFLSDTLFDLVLVVVHEIYYKNESVEAFDTFFPKMYSHLTSVVLGESSSFLELAWLEDALMMLMDIFYKTKVLGDQNGYLIRLLYSQLKGFDHLESISCLLREVKSEVISVGGL